MERHGFKNNLILTVWFIFFVFSNLSAQWQKPTGVTITSQGCNSYRISWNSINFQDVFKIYRSGDDGSFEIISSYFPGFSNPPIGTSNSYTDNGTYLRESGGQIGLSQNVTYTYQVVAGVGTPSSGNELPIHRSDPVTSRAISQARPPANFIAKPSGCGIELNWSANLFEEVYKYGIWRDNYEFLGEVAQTTGTLTYIDNTASPGNHIYRIRAANFCGPDDGWGQWVQTTYIYPVQTAPTGLTATNNLCDEIRTSWNSVPNAQEYEVWIENVGRVYAGTDLSANVDLATFNLTKGIPYGFIVRHKDECGVWSYNSPVVYGISPAVQAPYNLSSTKDAGGITIRWAHNNVATTKGFIIERSVAGGGSAFAITNLQDSPFAREFRDIEISQCVPYTYKVRAVTDCNATRIGNATTSNLLEPDLSSAFNDDGSSFSASKGYYTDYVKLDWINGLADQTNKVVVQRKQIGTNNPYITLTSENGDASLFNDFTAEAGVLYSYAIFAETPCENFTTRSDTVYSVGFKQKSGQVTGKVFYSGGIAVQGVKIVGQSTTGVTGHSLMFNGGGLRINENANMDLINDLLIESWIKPNSYNSDFTVFQKPGSYSLDFNVTTGAYEFEVTHSTGTADISVTHDSLPIGIWSHIAVQVDQDSLLFYVNGSLIAKKGIGAAINISNSSNDVSIGDNLAGNLKDIRIWTIAKPDSLVARDFNRFLNGNEAGLVCYLPMNEGIDTHTYDKSKSGTNIFNANHARFVGNVNWSDDIPDPIEKLSYASYTDRQGNYLITLPYYNAGENYILTPIYKTHEFDPSTRLLFVGDGATVINGIDFEDISSFKVTGRATFQNSTCNSSGVSIKIDGEYVIDNNGQIVTTQSDGTFEIAVPIGQHNIQLEKPGHNFSNGRFPATGNFDFQEPLSGLEFSDGTLKIVRGRVVGGQREANKKIGFNQSINNIGRATLTFEVEGSACLSETVMTDPSSGEYAVELPPLRFDQDVHIASNPALFLNLPPDKTSLDLSNNPDLTTVYDTTFWGDGSIRILDSMFYHVQNDHIEISNPRISVTDIDGKDFIGDTTYTYKSPTTGLDTTINLRQQPLRWPLFHEGGSEHVYTCLVKVFEIYENKDVPNAIKVDSVPAISGDILFANQLSNLDSLEIDNATKQKLSQVSLSEVNTIDTIRTLIYRFKPGAPNFIPLQPDPDQISFTRSLEITVITPTAQIDWTPPHFGGNAFPNDIYRGYILGDQSTGQQYVSVGPQTPSYILRDPPGSNSYATREVGTTKSTENSWSWTFGGSTQSTDVISTGSKFFGIETYANAEAGFTTEISGGEDGSRKEVVQNTKSWSTNSNNNLPGRGSDLYIGSAQNVEFGITEELTILPQSEASEVENLGSANSNYILAKTYGLSVNPTSQTHFIYDENHIKNHLIPDIKNLRNVFLSTRPDLYTCVVCSPSDPKYGLNNDDPSFTNPSTTTPRVEEDADVSGPSYMFLKANDDTMIDSVRWYNKQIFQWEEAIRLNEWEKLHIDDPRAISDFRALEEQRLENKYELTIKKYEQLQEASTGSLIGGAAASIIPIPGTSLLGYASFAVTSGTTIALAEATPRYEEYLAAKNRLEQKYADFYGRQKSISGGASFSESISHSSATSYNKSYDFNLSASLKAEMGVKGYGNGIELQRGLEVNFSSGRSWSEAEETTETVTYTINDPDQGDFFRFDVYPSLLGYGPIFKKRSGGQTSCPHEGKEVNEYYSDANHPLGSEEISEATRAIDVPSISVNKSIQTNIPADQPAVFNITLGNESFVGFQRIFNVQTVSVSNPNGAIVRIDGAASISPSIPGLSSVNKVLTVSKGAGPVYNYDSLLVIIYAPCQYTSGTSDNLDIADSIYISAHFIPTCTDVTVAAPEDQWSANHSNNNSIPITLLDYDINEDALNRLRIDYKPSEESSWRALQSFYKDTSGRNDANIIPIPTNTVYTQYTWDIEQLIDGNYDLRAISECTDTLGNVIATNVSEIHNGYIDRIKPHPFGTPSPADGILEPNDDILIKMNETVETGSVTRSNFDVRGVLNGSALRHETSLSFNGVGNEVKIPAYQLQKRSLTIEFWLKRNGLGDQMILSQGNSSSEQLALFFNDQDQLVFQLGAKEIKSEKIVQDQDWHHYAVVYDRARIDAEIYIDYQVDKKDINFETDYNDSGPIFIGKDASDVIPSFQGFMHELRLWSISKTESQIASQGLKSLSGRESGLMGNWPMTEGNGNSIIDKVRSRHGILSGPTWSILPQNHSYDLNGEPKFLVANNASSLTFDEETDITIEAWFRTDHTLQQTILSNGLADGSTSANFTWNIFLDDSGSLVAENDGQRISSPPNLNDNNWHHFSIVVERTRAISLFIDGDLVATGNASEFKGFAGPNLWVGVRGWFDASIENHDSYFSGQIDEIRVWNLARKSEQIRRDMLFQLNGDEMGLEAYYPFDAVMESSGVLIRNQNLLDASINNFNLSTNTAGAEAFSLNAPPVKLPRTVQNVNYTYSINNDEIYIEISDPPALVENVTLDITVSGLKDLAGNTMESPETWTAYIDKNQVFWDTEYYNLKKKQNDALSFTATIKNTGGSQEAFELSNLPIWLSASPASGLIDPNSSVQVDFTISSFVEIGKYEQDIYVTTESFGFNERLLLDLSVYADPPDWQVDPEGFESSMSYVGEVFVNRIISTDEEDIIVALIDDEIRGRANVSYSSNTGKHLVFLDVYGNGDQHPNSDNNKLITFKLWDASEGEVRPNVSPLDNQWIEGTLNGRLSDPVPFEATDSREVTYYLKAGWNWISFPLESSELDTLDSLLQSIDLSSGDRILSHVNSAVYVNPILGWQMDQSLRQDGLMIEQGYRFYASQSDTLVYRGLFEDPEDHPIHLIPGWNSIGMISESVQDVATALASLNPQNGDWIKGQKSFAVYETGFGWSGSLDVLEPKSSYMLYSKHADILTYQKVSSFKSQHLKSNDFQDQLYSHYHVKPEAYDFSMSMVASIAGFDSWTSHNEWYLVVFNGEQCQGINKINRDDGRNLRLAYLQIFGNSEDDLSFKLISKDGSTIIDLEESFTFSPDATMGLPSQPVVFTVGSSPCAKTMDLSEDYLTYVSGNGRIQVEQRLSINVPIQAKDELQFMAGQSIELRSGFVAPKGSSISLTIQPCER